MGSGLSSSQQEGLFVPSATWNRTTYSALAALFLIWAVKFYTTWAAWGSLSSDSGHEMYIPAQLAQGKQLYRDIWFMYGPASAYFNGCLFRVFGIHLAVLYWAGSLSALVSAIFLYLVGMRLTHWLIGWTAAAALLLEAFHPTIFCFPLPYTFAAVYACLVGCIFLWISVVAVDSSHWAWIVAAGLAAGIALLEKPEYGVACFGTLCLLIAVRAFRKRSLSTIPTDILATLPGIVLCASVIYWMVSIRGLEFITQENILSWPTSYFMKNFGMQWLAANGFTMNADAFAAAFWRSIVPVGVLVFAYSLLWWKRWDRQAVLVRAALILGLILYVRKSILFVSPLPVPLAERLSVVFFPQDMVFYVVIATIAIWVYLLLQPEEFSPAIPLVMTYASLSSFRILMGMHPVGYPIFYNGPVILCFLLLFCLVVPPSRRQPHWSVAGKALTCFGCLLTIFLSSESIEARATNYEVLQTERGVVRTTRHMRRNYEAALTFMKEKAAHGETVLSVPEDVSLYFLAGTQCPTRVFQFSPGAVAPGKMTDEAIQEIEKNHVRYVLWSNQEYRDFGVPVFGKDYNQALGDYLRAHFRRVGPLTTGTGPGWSADIWERIPAL
jgi:hypothetical protein